MKTHERAAKRIYTPEQLARKREYKASRKEHYAELNRKYRQEHREELMEYLRNWKLNNPDRVAELRISYQERNRGRIAERRRVAGSAELIKARLERRRTDPEYLARHNAARAIRRAAVSRATPKWADRKEMEQFYIEAKKKSIDEGVKYHVDHVIPLNHKLVCGLHVPSNLRVVLGAVNMSKQNKFLVDEIV